MSEKEEIINLDDFREKANIKKQQEAANASFTAEEQSALEAAFEHGRTLGVFKNARLDNNRKTSLYRIEVISNDRQTLNVSKRNVLGNFSYAEDSAKEGNLQPCYDFKALVNVLYDYTLAATSPKDAKPAPEV